MLQITVFAGLGKNAADYSICGSWNISNAASYSISQGPGEHRTTGPEDHRTKGPEPHLCKKNWTLPLKGTPNPKPSEANRGWPHHELLAR